MNTLDVGQGQAADAVAGRAEGPPQAKRLPHRLVVLHRRGLGVRVPGAVGPREEPVRFFVADDPAATGSH